MEDNFTYEQVDDTHFFNSLLRYLEIEGESKLLSLIQDGYCDINYSTQYSQNYSKYGRWNAYHAEVIFAISLDKMGIVEFWHKRELRKYCSTLFPSKYGYDINFIEFKPLIDKKDKIDIKEEMEISSTVSTTVINKLLPKELIDEARNMTDVYFTLFVIENTVRIFIDSVTNIKSGSISPSELNIPTKIKKKIKARKMEEEKNKWLPIRGNSFVYYLDFIELGDIIKNNWEWFKEYFPNQEFIISKLNEIAKIRNFVAHNSSISQDEQDILRIYFKQILIQISNSGFY